MWGLWIYMILPVINIVLWIFGIRYFHISIIEKAGYRELLHLVGNMGWSVLAVFLIMRLWGFYNYRKFGRKDRRTGKVPYDSGKVAELYDISAETIRDLQSKKEIVWQITDDSGMKK
jgi:poly-beta-1,6-N-acetyl-D-glucosamine biosynthesis protein PgaD